MTGKIIAQKKSQRLVVGTEIWNTKSGIGYKAVVRNPNGTFDGATNQTKFFEMPKAEVITKTVTVPAQRRKFLGLF
jgi:hypothetical protein